MILELPPIVLDAFHELLEGAHAPWVALYDANQSEFLDPYQYCASSLKCGYGRAPWLGGELGARWKRPEWDRETIPVPRFAAAWTARHGGKQLTLLHPIDLVAVRERTG